MFTELNLSQLDHRYYRDMSIISMAGLSSPHHSHFNYHLAIAYANQTKGQVLTGITIAEGVVVSLGLHSMIADYKTADTNCSYKHSN